MFLYMYWMLLFFYVSAELDEGVTEFYDTDRTPIHMIVSGSVMVSDEYRGRSMRNKIPHADKIKIYARSTIARPAHKKHSVIRSKTLGPKINKHHHHTHHKKHTVLLGNLRNTVTGQVRNEIPDKHMVHAKTIYPPPSNMWKINKELTETEHTLEEKGQLQIPKDSAASQFDLDNKIASSENSILKNTKTNSIEANKKALKGKAEVTKLHNSLHRLAPAKHIGNKDQSRNLNLIETGTTMKNENSNPVVRVDQHKLGQPVRVNDWQDGFLAKQRTSLGKEVLVNKHLQTITKEKSVQDGGVLLNGKEPVFLLKKQVKPLVEQTNTAVEHLSGNEAIHSDAPDISANHAKFNSREQTVQNPAGYDDQPENKQTFTSTSFQNTYHSTNGNGGSDDPNKSELRQPNQQALESKPSHESITHVVDGEDPYHESITHVIDNDHKNQVSDHTNNKYEDETGHNVFDLNKPDEYPIIIDNPEASHQSVNNKSPLIEATHSVNLANTPTDHTVNGEKQLAENRHASVNGETQLAADNTHTSVNGETQLADNTHASVNGETQLEDNTHTSVNGETQLADNTHASINGETQLAENTHASVSGEIQLAENTHASVNGETQLAENTHTPVNGENQFINPPHHQPIAINRPESTHPLDIHQGNKNTPLKHQEDVTNHVTDSGQVFSFHPEKTKDETESTDVYLHPSVTRDDRRPESHLEVPFVGTYLKEVGGKVNAPNQYTLTTEELKTVSQPNGYINENEKMVSAKANPVDNQITITAESPQEEEETVADLQRNTAVGSPEERLHDKAAIEKPTVLQGLEKQEKEVGDNEVAIQQQSQIAREELDKQANAMQQTATNLIHHLQDMPAEALNENLQPAIMPSQTEHAVYTNGNGQVTNVGMPMNFDTNSSNLPIISAATDINSVPEYHAYGDLASRTVVSSTSPSYDQLLPAVPDRTSVYSEEASWPAGVNPGAQLSNEMTDLWKVKGIAPEKGFLRGRIHPKQKYFIDPKYKKLYLQKYQQAKIKGSLFHSAPNNVMSVLKPRRPTGPSIAYEQSFPETREVYTHSKSSSKVKVSASAASASSSNNNSAVESVGEVNKGSNSNLSLRHHQKKPSNGYGYGSGQGSGYGTKSWGWGGGGGWSGSQPGGGMPSPSDYSSPPSNIPGFPSTDSNNAAQPAASTNPAPAATNVASSNNATLAVGTESTAPAAPAVSASLAQQQGTPQYLNAVKIPSLKERSKKLREKFDKSKEGITTKQQKVKNILKTTNIKVEKHKAQKTNKLTNKQTKEQNSKSNYKVYKESRKV